MALALNTHAFHRAGWPVDKCLRTARRLGFSGVEIEHADVASGSSRNRRELIKVSRDLGLRCSQLHLSGVWLNAADVRTRTRALDALKLATELQYELGGRQLAIGSECLVRTSDLLAEQSWSVGVEAVRRAAEWGLRDGLILTIGLEPEVFALTHSVERLRRLLDDVEMPNVLADLDVSAAAFMRDGPGRLAGLAGRILYLHVQGCTALVGKADLAAYVRKARDLGLEETARRMGEPCWFGLRPPVRQSLPTAPEEWAIAALADVAHELPTPATHPAGLLVQPKLHSYVQV